MRHLVAGVVAALVAAGSTGIGTEAPGVGEALARKSSDSETLATDSLSGIVTQDLETRAGVVRVVLPDDIRAGDTISGTVTAEPAGRTEEERRRNFAQLSDFRIAIERVPASLRLVCSEGVCLGSESLTFAVPGPRVEIELRSGAGRRLDRVRIDSGPPGPPVERLAPPPLGQQGRPIAIAGPFDGDIGTTRIAIGGEPAAILAESPRAAVVRVPSGPPGSAPLRISEAGVGREFPFRSISVSLRAASLSLQRGESTMLTVIVEGLPPTIETEMVPLTLAGSETIRLDGGNRQTVMLRPNAAGRAQFERQIVARSPGPFQISAVLGEPSHPR